MSLPRWLGAGRAILTGLALGFSAFGGAASTKNDGASLSGDYGDLIVGLDPSTQRVSGYYSSSTGRGQFSCIFYFSGTLRKGRARIDSYFPGALPSDHISGIATLTRGGAAIIALEKEHGGCWNVQHFADKSYLAKFQLAAPYRWRSIRVVRAARAYFYDAPGIPKHRAAYVVRGDGVGVLASANESNREWIKVDFVGEPNSQSGWLRKSDLYPD